MDQWYSSIHWSKALIQPLQRSLIGTSCVKKSVQSGVCLLSASFEDIYCQPLASHGSFNTAIPKHDQSRALRIAEVHRHPDFKEILAEVLQCLDVYSSFLRSSRQMFRYGVSKALPDYLQLLFGTLSERTVIFAFAFKSQVETHGKSLFQSASLIVSYLVHCLLSLASISSSG